MLKFLVYRVADLDAAVVWLGSSGPKGLDQATYRRLLMGRNRYATEQLGAVASIGPATGAGRAGLGFPSSLSSRSRPSRPASC